VITTYSKSTKILLWYLWTEKHIIKTQQKHIHAKKSGNVQYRLVTEQKLTVSLVTFLSGSKIYKIKHYTAPQYQHKLSPRMVLVCVSQYRNTDLC